MSKLPPTWAIGLVGDLVELNPKNYSPDQTEVGFVPLQRLGVDYRARHSFEPRPWSAVKKGYTHFADGDVLLAKITPCFENGKAGIVRGLPSGIGAGSTEYFVCRPLNDVLLPEYLLALFKTRRFLRAGKLVMSGAVGQQRIPKEYLLDSEIPLPPLNEQKRIVDKLDDLLTRVDACRQRLDRVPAILKRFRQSVLAAATSGELTKDWRAEHGLKLSSWRKTTFEKICTDITVGFVGKMATEYRSSGVPFLRSQNVRPFRFDAREIKYISSEFHCSIQKSTLRPGDVVVVRTGAPGQCCVIPPELEEANCSDLVIVRPNNELHSSFAVVFINSETSQSFVKSEQVGVAQLHFNVGSMKRAPVNLPSLDEQREIARRVDELFASTEQLEARYASGRALVERITAALLAKAFRGELVPQDPNDEPASELLERIRAERPADGPPQPRRGRRTSPERQEDSPAPSFSTPPEKRENVSQATPPNSRRPYQPKSEPQDPAESNDRRPIEDYTTDEMMAHFRSASRGCGDLTEASLLHGVLARLGFDRLGAKVTPILKGYLKAAVGRGIIERDGFFLRCKTPTILHYETPILVDALTSVMRKNQPYDREEVIQALAGRLGYSTVSDAMRGAMKTVFNSAIRQGVLSRAGSTITRGG